MAASNHRGALSGCRAHPVRPYPPLHAASLWWDDAGNGAQHHHGHRLAPWGLRGACLVRGAACHAAPPLAAANWPCHPLRANRLISGAAALLLIGPRVTAFSPICHKGPHGGQGQGCPSNEPIPLANRRTAQTCKPVREVGRRSCLAVRKIKQNIPKVFNCSACNAGCFSTFLISPMVSEPKPATPDLSANAGPCTRKRTR